MTTSCIGHHVILYLYLAVKKNMPCTPSRSYSPKNDWKPSRCTISFAWLAATFGTHGIAFFVRLPWTCAGQMKRTTFLSFMKRINSWIFSTFIDLIGLKAKNMEWLAESFSRMNKFAAFHLLTNLLLWEWVAMKHFPIATCCRDEKSWCHCGSELKILCRYWVLFLSYLCPF